MSTKGTFNSSRYQKDLTAINLKEIKTKKRKGLFGTTPTHSPTQANQDVGNQALQIKVDAFTTLDKLQIKSPNNSEKELTEHHNNSEKVS